MNKRSFLKKASLASLATIVSFPALSKILDSVAHLSPEEITSDEEFWKAIRNAYKLKPDYINLENGYYCILPEEVLENYFKHIREVNLQGAYYMRTVQFDNKKAAVTKLAEIAGCSNEELIITRNTTESLDMIISGQDWKAGDEAVFADQD